MPATLVMVESTLTVPLTSRVTARVPLAMPMPEGLEWRERCVGDARSRAPHGGPPPHPGRGLAFVARFPFPTRFVDRLFLLNTVVGPLDIALGFHGNYCEAVF